MLGKILANIARFLLLVLLQGLILNNFTLFQGLAIPYLYVLFLLMLPIETPRWLQLIIGLATGLTIDMFTNTMGMHASACVLLAYLRPLVLKAIAPRDGYEFGQKASIAEFGIGWYLRYAVLLVVTHHAWLLFVEVFSLRDAGYTALRVLLSSAFTLLLIVLAQYITYSRKSKA
jgi:rod shape-determining protein MreD